MQPDSCRSEIFLETDAEWVADVATVRRDRSKARRLVESDGFRLSVTGFQSKNTVTKSRCNSLQFSEKFEANAAAPDLRCHIHAPDFCRLRVQWSQGAAANCLAVKTSDEKSASGDEPVLTYSTSSTRTLSPGSSTTSPPRSFRAEPDCVVPR